MNKDELKAFLDTLNAKEESVPLRFSAGTEDGKTYIRAIMVCSVDGVLEEGSLEASDRTAVLAACHSVIGYLIEKAISGNISKVEDLYYRMGKSLEKFKKTTVIVKEKK